MTTKIIVSTRKVVKRCREIPGGGCDNPVVLQSGKYLRMPDLIGIAREKGVESASIKCSKCGRNLCLHDMPMYIPA
ncbi:MAG: hypothetical protein ABJA67_18055 [Chthonomonadales bacterium]